MKHFPDHLADRFRRFKHRHFAPNQDHYEKLAAEGFAEMYGIQGIMTRIQEYSGWRSSWVLAATGRFLGNGRDQLAMYDRGRF